MSSLASGKRPVEGTVLLLSRESGACAPTYSFSFCKTNPSISTAAASLSPPVYSISLASLSVGRSSFSPRALPDTKHDSSRRLACLALIQRLGAELDLWAPRMFVCGVLEELYGKLVD